MIAVVIPTIRPSSYKEFLKAWEGYFGIYNVILITVKDGKNPKVNGKDVKEVMGEHSDLIYNYNDGVRNLGFAYVAKYHPQVSIIVSFDDDVRPISGHDTLSEHLNALNQRRATTWLSTASHFTRGFPYNAREESETVLSHGVWEGVADWDAATQLVNGNPKTEFYKGVIPKGTLFPLCAMNFAFKRKALPYIYQAPMFGDLNRFADIWGGIEAKRDLDKLGYATVSGYARIYHPRASNVFENMIKEARGLKMNENYGKDPYFKLFFEKRKRWKEFIAKYDKRNNDSL